MSERKATDPWFIICAKRMPHRQHPDDKPAPMDTWLKNLSGIGWEVYYPMISEMRRVPRRELAKTQRNLAIPRVRARMGPFLPGYVFVRGRELREVMSFPCVTGYVSTTGNAPAQISHELI